MWEDERATLLLRRPSATGRMMTGGRKVDEAEEVEVDLDERRLKRPAKLGQADGFFVLSLVASFSSSSFDPASLSSRSRARCLPLPFAVDEEEADDPAVREPDALGRALSARSVRGRRVPKLAAQSFD